MKVYPCAKINLGLNIVNRRPDGYHDLQTVFYPVALHDEIELIAQPETADPQAPRCTLEVRGVPIEGDMERNLVVRAYRLLAEDYPLARVHIILYKHIPMQAGMGGGSADCAYTICALNELCHLHLTNEQMQRYAARLGADCAFFVSAQPAYAEGIGELLSPISLDLSRYWIAIVKPPVAVSTREAFARISVKMPAWCCRDVVREPIDTWRGRLSNDFEESIFPQYPAIARIKEQLYQQGAVYAAMSGSGSALFGIFKEQPQGLETLFPGCYTAVVRG